VPAVAINRVDEIEDEQEKPEVVKTHLAAAGGGALQDFLELLGPGTRFAMINRMLSPSLQACQYHQIDVEPTPHSLHCVLLGGFCF
jgi:hypothetical protein